MKITNRNALIAFPFIVLIGLAVALAGSQGGRALAGIPLFALLVAFIYVVQWLAFIPAYLLHTERFFDITGGLTYVVVITLALLFSPGLDGRSLLLWALVTLWAIRLGSFLFRRIHKAGKDVRFDDVRSSFVGFLTVWTVQGLWIALTVAAALVAITTTHHKELDGFAVVGLIVWMIGFALEVVADFQKSRFAANPANKGKFIQTGLWSRSRHPNYLGEIVLWAGIAIIALPVLQGWQWVALVSPLFVALLLTRISGVPLLETKADQKWGGQPDYEAYKQRTPVLIPRL